MDLGTDHLRRRWTADGKAEQKMAACERLYLWRDAILAAAGVGALLVGNSIERYGLDQVPAGFSHIVDGEFFGRAKMSVQVLHILRRDRDPDSWLGYRGLRLVLGINDAQSAYRCHGALHDS